MSKLFLSIYSMTTSAALQAITSAAATGDLLRALKELKNSVIGNTWKKVGLASDDTLLHYLIDLLVLPAYGDSEGVGIVCEAAVIIGALGSAGALTLRPLLAERVPARLLGLVCQVPPDHPSAARMLSPLLRALRNILGATADAVWGHMWGVGAEQKVIGTGLVGDDVLLPARARGKHHAAAWKANASEALGLVFEQTNRLALVSLIDEYEEVTVLLPLYQLLARLVVLPAQRETLGLYSTGDGTLQPHLVHHLLETIMDWWTPRRRPNPKLLEAALDLLSALVKGQPQVAAIVREWLAPMSVSVDDGTLALPDVISVMVQLLETGPTGARIAVAGCLTNIFKADNPQHSRDRVSLNLTNLNLLHAIAKLLRAEAIEERVKLCFVLAALVSDDERLQRAAAEQGCPAQLISMLVEVDADETRGELGHDAASRMREGALLALASLAFQFEPTRSLITDSSPPILPLVCASLSHPSYGVRAAACQLARALSRTVAILKTSLVDSGIGEEVVETLKREVARRRDESNDGVMDMTDSGIDIMPEEELGDRAWTVEVAATATICNLVTDFSPLKDKLLATGGLELLVELTSSTYEPLVLNALWALKNVTFHATETLKADVMTAMTWKTLCHFLSPSAAAPLRSQALDLVQNLVDDQSPVELNRTLENLGADFALDVIQSAISSEDVELREPGLYILSHLALGSERLRSSLTSRVGLLEALSASLDSRHDLVLIPALRALRHLIESNSRSQRPRQAVVDLLQPYQLKTRARELSEVGTSSAVRQGAVILVDLLERAR